MGAIFRYLVTGGVTLIGAIIGLVFYKQKYDECKDLKLQVRQYREISDRKEMDLAEFRARINNVIREVDNLRERRRISEQQNENYINQIQGLTHTVNQRDQKVGELSNIIANFEQKIEEDKSGGDGDLHQSQPLSVQEAYYSVEKLNRELKQVLQGSCDTQVQPDNSIFIASTNSENSRLPAIVLPGVTEKLLNSGFVSKRLLHAFNNLLFSNHDRCTILIPFLDTQKDHWVFIELVVTKRAEQLKVQATLNDPRGGGQLSAQQINSLQEIFAKISPQKVEFEATPSRYLTPRQAPADHVSCGPIVINEIFLRLRNVELDRENPYDFGRAPLAKSANQNQEGLKIANISRHLFLSSSAKLNQADVPHQGIQIPMIIRR